MICTARFQNTLAQKNAETLSENTKHLVYVLYSVSFSWSETRTIILSGEMGVSPVALTTSLLICSGGFYVGLLLFVSASFLSDRSSHFSLRGREKKAPSEKARQTDHFFGEENPREIGRTLHLCTEIQRVIQSG